MKSFNYFVLFILFTFSSSELLPQKIAFTFDDAPKKNGSYFTGTERAEIIIKKLRLFNIRAAFFCISGNIDAEGFERLQLYDNAGHFIANHTHTHSRYTTIGIDNYISEIHTADSILKQFNNYKRWFRYPFLDEGRTFEDRDKIREALNSSGYFHAYVTIDNYDWYIDYLVSRHSRDSIHLENLKEFYLKHVYESILFYENVGLETLGRSVNHVLLLHENDLAALFIDDLSRLLLKNGWEIISPEEAYRDEIAVLIPDVLFNYQGRVAAIANWMGRKKSELVQESEDEDYLNKQAEELKVFKYSDK